MLWPYLVEFLTPAEYTGALGVMCKCVASIGFKKRKAGDEDYKLNFAEQGMQVWFEGFKCFIVQYRPSLVLRPLCQVR